MRTKSITKYFKKPTTGVVFKKDKWKYVTASIIKDVAEVILYLLVMGGVCWLALYSFFNLAE